MIASAKARCKDEDLDVIRLASGQPSIKQAKKWREDSLLLVDVYV